MNLNNQQSQRMMSDNVNKTLWDLLQSRSIVIPVIQRDYAQGRDGKESLRNRFLKNLKHALDNSKRMELDFVYGSTEGDIFFPLDGQQRLTTLWLLHWYVALRAGVLNEETCNILRKFTYQTRVSSREFCEKLCEHTNFKDASNVVNIKSFIENSTWFYSLWKQDPTIKAMLTMLGGTKIYDKRGLDIIDGIEELFKECDKDKFKEYWQRLTQHKIIGFSYLQLKDFGLSDDLYIKMNARGKALSPFENFKADLIGYIRDESDKEEHSGEADANNMWKTLLDSEDGIPKKLDTTWMSIFWKQKNRESEEDLYRVDEIYYAFFNRFFWNELFIAKIQDDYILKVGEEKSEGRTVSAESKNESYKYFNADDYSVYYDFTHYRYCNGSIPIEFFKKLVKVLDGYSILFKDGNEDSILREGDSDFRFIPKYKKNEDNTLSVISINQVQRIAFFAICKFLSEVDLTSGLTDIMITLKRWMRVVWNLISIYDIDGRSGLRNTQAIRTATSLIDGLNSQDVYNDLIDRDTTTIGNSELECRLKEEIIKCNQMTQDEAWENKIIKAENTLFFKGGIRFLYHNDKDDVDWSRFDEKLKKVEELFEAKGIKDLHCIDVIQRFVVQNSINSILDKTLFNGKKETWNWVLNNSSFHRSVHNLLISDKVDVFVDDNADLQPSWDWPFEYMVTNELFDSKGRFHWSNGLLAFYKPYGTDALLLDQKDFMRNKILSELCKTDKYQTEKRIKNTEFFYGWDVLFNNSQSEKFIWLRTNEVYRAEDNGNKTDDLICSSPKNIDDIQQK